MDKLQFNFDENSLYSPLSPEVIDISSELEETFSIAPGNVSQLGIRVHRQAIFAQSATLCFQYLGFHDHTFNRAKLANYVICPGFHGFSRGFQ